MTERDQRSMSIVPYSSSSRDVVLRHNDSIVVFDHASRQLVLHDNKQEGDVKLADCPYCHRPLRDATPEPGRDAGGRSSTPGVQQGFVNPDYFRMLEASLPSTPLPSGPPSPRRRLVQQAQADNGASSAGYLDETPPPPHPTTPGISSAALSPNYFKRFFVEERELGRGGKGVVLLVQHVLDGVSLGQYACKRVPVGDDHEWLKKVLIEVQLLQHLSHQNLVSYRHVWLEDVKLSTFGPSVPCAFILQQYCNAGDLQKYICGDIPIIDTKQQLKDRLRRRSKGQPELPTTRGLRKLQLDDIYSFFKDITSGIRFLHANGYIHRDLKPNNCLLHEVGGELRVLVSDFGEVQSEHAVRTSTGATGTVSYCAPEVLRRVSPGGPYGNFTFKSDVFSLGMILYFLCFAQLPYRNADVVNEEREDLDQLRAEISQWTGFDDARRLRPELPEKLYMFLKRLLSVDPGERPTADEVLSGIQAGVGLNNNHRFFHRGNGTTGSSDGNGRAGSSRVIPVDSPSQTPPTTATSRGPRSPSKAVKVVKAKSGFGTGMVPVVHQQQRKSYGGTEGAPDTSYMSDSASESPTEQDLMVRSSSLAANRHTPPHIHHHHVQPNLQPYTNGSNHTTRPLLLPPPTHHNHPFPPRPFLRRPTTLKALSFILLILKILSVTQPCTPAAVNPSIFYPLLVLATVDFAVLNNGNARIWWIRGASVLVHFGVLGWAVRRGMLCASVG
ncbi:IKS protein kinase [Polytolypa hystricis UAMH7299]|uniref:non-specific serine/threonine protein kinase n=1 Tax=Polytolypa hystricis (strain UAMH7299) TaxID=1447883 RepID=A0A2B7Z5A0_POLH7|nr:IKS protein kinase [Polytolypa hystricis UAMH7299]